MGVNLGTYFFNSPCKNTRQFKNTWVSFVVMFSFCCCLAKSYWDVTQHFGNICSRWTLENESKDIIRRAPDENLVPKITKGPFLMCLYLNIVRHCPIYLFSSLPKMLSFYQCNVICEVKAPGQ